jgi:hypothetical protein
MPTLYNVSQAAAVLKTSPTTTRRLADAMADILPDYSPSTGKARQFTDNDLRTLVALSSRLSATPGVSRAALLSELSAPGSEPLIISENLPTATPQATKNDKAIVEALQPFQNAIEPFLAAQDVTQTQIEILSAQMSELAAKQDQTPQPVFATTDRMATLAAVGVLTVGIIGASILQLPIIGLVSAGIALLILIAALAAPSFRG